MSAFLLIAHIVLAFMSLGLAGSVVWADIRHHITQADAQVKRMWLVTLATTISGIGLTLVSGASITSACASLSIFIAVALGAHVYHKTVQRKLYSAK